MRLFWTPISPPCRTIRMVIEALKIKVDLQEVDILTRSYLSTELVKLNPQHTVPTLVDNNFTIWDSHAIGAYLVEKYAPNYVLYPSEPRTRAIVNQRLHFDSGILFPNLRNCVMPILFGNEKSIKHTNAVAVKQAYGFLESFLKRSEWLVEDHITLADFSCMTTLSTLDYLLPIDKETTPKLYRYLKRCQKLPYYEELNQDGLNKLGKIIQEKIIRSQDTDPH